MSAQIRMAKRAIQVRPSAFNPTPRRGGVSVMARAGGLRSGPGFSSPAGRRIVARGDPGLFGFVGDVFKAAGSLALSAIKTTPIGGAITAGLGAVTGFLGGRAVSTNDPNVIAQIQGTSPRTAATRVTVRPGVGEVAMFSQAAPQEVRPTPGVRGAIERFFPGGATGFQVDPVLTQGVPSGMHLNKSSYFLMDGTFVPEGTRLVKNRRRNPLNPRAFDRALGRITAAKKFGERLGRVTIRKKKC